MGTSLGVRRLIEGTGDDRRLVISFTGVLPGEGQQQGVQNDFGARNLSGIT